MAKNIKMNPKIKQKWISALKSGKYKQTQNQLKDENGFCCLGVLCDIYSKTQKKAGVKFDPTFTFFDGVSTETTGLPPKVLKWAGLKEDDEFVSIKIPKVSNTSLVSLNDNGESFKKIAKVIENIYKDEFRN